MELVNTCPCCSERLLRHVRTGSIYWFCSHCWQEMPNLQSTLAERQASELGILERLVLKSNQVAAITANSLSNAAVSNVAV
jgi:hypothetical protein